MDGWMDVSYNLSARKCWHFPPPCLCFSLISLISSSSVFSPTWQFLQNITNSYKTIPAILLFFSSLPQKACSCELPCGFVIRRHSISLSVTLASRLFSSPIHGTNQYCDALIQLKARRKSCLLVHHSHADEMITGV